MRRAAQPTMKLCLGLGRLWLTMVRVCCEEPPPRGAALARFGPCSVPCVGLLSQSPADACWFLNPGWEKLDIGCVENYTAWRQGRSPERPGLERDLQGAPEADASPLEPDERVSSLDMGWRGETSSVWFSSLSGERRDLPINRREPGVNAARSGSASERLVRQTLSQQPPAGS